MVHTKGRSVAGPTDALIYIPSEIFLQQFGLELVLPPPLYPTGRSISETPYHSRVTRQRPLPVQRPPPQNCVCSPQGQRLCTYVQNILDRDTKQQKFNPHKKRRKLSQYLEPLITELSRYLEPLRRETQWIYGATTEGNSADIQSLCRRKLRRYLELLIKKTQPISGAPIEGNLVDIQSSYMQ